MKRNMRLPARPLLVLLGLLLVTGLVLAQGGYDLVWWTIDGGGALSTGGGYALSGSIGQADAGALSGEDYTLLGGFWGKVEMPGRLYLPVMLRN